MILMDKKDNSVRQKKVASLLQGLVARYFTEESANWGIRSLVLVDDVFVSPDIKNAQVWVSFSPHDPKVAQKRFEIVEKKLREIQNYLFDQMEIRRVPQLTLRLSDPDKTFKLIDIFGTLDSHGPDTPEDSRDTEGE